MFPKKKKEGARARGGGGDLAKAKIIVLGGKVWERKQLSIDKQLK